MLRRFLRYFTPVLANTVLPMPLAVKVLENIPCDLLPGVLEQIIPYHTREKMHRVKGQKKRKTAGKKKEESVSTEPPVPQKVS